jgi:hypothetical protein
LEVTSVPVTREMTMPRKPKRDDIAVKIEAAVYRQARIVAARQDITIAEYLSALLREPVAEDYHRAVAQMAQETKKEHPKKGSKG